MLTDRPRPAANYSAKDKTEKVAILGIFHRQNNRGPQKGDYACRDINIGVLPSNRFLKHGQQRPGILNTHVPWMLSNPCLQEHREEEDVALQSRNRVRNGLCRRIRNFSFIFRRRDKLKGCSCQVSGALTRGDCYYF
ncbi:hypothetical protein NPIL_540901 [Nephila pilipes]|uniref:Uncharacterized protein n=1 Tax=Nephila pilipes TaxID=299642 RepID=A0A8X6U0S8_NEPPI|nr:hypothetical protein NPIL_540901 [Nephila pilipes]